MDKIMLALSSRKVLGKANAGLRAQGEMPAVVYGHGIEAESVQVSTKELTRVYNEAGGNRIISLKIDGSREQNALIHDVQHNGLTGELTHADFYIVRMDEKLTTDIPLYFVGESTAVFQDEGVLLKAIESVEVEALPGDLPENIEVDISVLDDFEKAIHVSDLKVPKGVEILDEADTLVARVEAPRSEEEMAELETEVTETLPEGVAEEVVPDGDAKTDKSDK